MIDHQHCAAFARAPALSLAGREIDVEEMDGAGLAVALPGPFDIALCTGVDPFVAQREVNALLDPSDRAQKRIAAARRGCLHYTPP